jgi:hypothetical protein
VIPKLTRQDQHKWKDKDKDNDDDNNNNNNNNNNVTAILVLLFSNMNTMKNNTRIAATWCSLGTWFVSGI